MTPRQLYRPAKMQHPGPLCGWTYAVTVVRIGLRDSDHSVHMCDTSKCQCVEIHGRYQKWRSKIGSSLTGVMLHATALLPPVPASPTRQQMLLHSFARKSWRQSSKCKKSVWSNIPHCCRQHRSDGQLVCFVLEYDRCQQHEG